MKDGFGLKFVLAFLFILAGLIFKNHYMYIYEVKHIDFIRKTAAECTLFLNKNNEFPIKKPCKALLIGSGARNTVKGGLGSGDVESNYYTTCEQGLENAGFIITTKNWLYNYPFLKQQKIHEHLEYLKDLYTKNNVTQCYRMITFPEYDYDLKLNEDEEKADIAIYVVARSSGEGTDRRIIKGDAQLTDTEIKDIIYLNNKFKKFMLVINTGGVVDLSPVKDVSNILLLSQLGVVTGDILADIILGKVNPSGKLATTWTAITDYKFINEFGDGNNTFYREGVYVGYRFFDSANIQPLYPFGYGKSYTDFQISKISLTNKRDEITINVKVKNIGKFSGKEVVQVYISPSQENIDKPYQSLITFKKTPLLKPSKEIDMSLTFKLSDVARYDEEIACYRLDKGNYIIRVGNSSRNTEVYGYVELDDDTLTKQLKNIDGKPGFKDYKPIVKITDDLSNVQKISLKKEEDFDFKRIDYTFNYKEYNIIKNLTNSELAYLCVGGFAEKDENNERERGLNGLTTNKVKKIKHHLRMCDGPSGLRIARVYNTDSRGFFHRLSPNPSILNNYKYITSLEKIYLSKINIPEDYSNYTNVKYQYTTAIPIPTAVAQTFNTELAKKYGNILGTELELFNIDILLAPAMNIHRNILCGRNFEYYSEDPLISGKMAAAFIKGIQSHKNKGTTIKHFAGNNQENNRLNSNSRISERALREIYLKGFQIAVEEAQPIALMTSYNLINGIHPSENYQLMISTIRCEWNYEGLVMTDWIRTGQVEYPTSIYPAQYINNTILAGNNIMMPGCKNDYKFLLEKLEKKEMEREDLYFCASKVYETVLKLNK